MHEPTAQPVVSRPTALFRSEAVGHATVKTHGTILLARPHSFAVLTGLAGAVVLGILAFVLCFSYQRKVQVAGVLLPEFGLVRVVALQAGTVVERRVNEGQAVKAGDALFVLANERVSATRGDADQSASTELESRRSSLLDEREQVRQQSADRLAATTRRTTELAQELTRVDAQMALQRRRVKLAAESLARYTQLQRENFVAAAQVQDRQGDLIDQQQKLAEMVRLKAAAARELDAAQAELNERKVQALRDQAAASRSIAAVDQDLSDSEARRRLVVRAQQDGVVTGITVDPGQSVPVGAAMATLLPRGARLQAELYAPSRAAGFLQKDMPVLIRYPAYPYQKFGQHGGRLQNVSISAMRADELPLPGAALQAVNAAEPLYRLRVSLDQQAILARGQRHDLKSGMLVEASILLDKRPLYEWLLDPVTSVTGRL